MSKIGVSLKIDVSKIDKNRLFSGQKGTYLDATVFIDIDQLDQYGNSGMITQDVSKEEKQQGVKGNILGNCKVFWNDSGQQSAPQQNQGWGQPQQPQQQPQQQQQRAPQQQQRAPQQAQPQYNEPPMDFDDDIPFAPVGLMHNNNLMHCI
ncbi:hypothetical protein NVP1112O_58 [Vibrio phage 1.112.O._10N.286.46.B11]|nr:hypothetical protein NVP1112O_58 [Vibrio phage 1.112.O._10N.286.46.B11]